MIVAEYRNGRKAVAPHSPPRRSRARASAVPARVPPTVARVDDGAKEEGRPYRYARHVEELVLSRSQRNDVLLAITDAGLSPNAFRWEGAREKQRLVHVPTRALFTFVGHRRVLTEGDDGGLLALTGAFLPWPTSRHLRIVRRWSWQMTRFSRWLTQLKLEYDTPDLWAQLEHDEDVFAAASDASIENTPFTVAERHEIAAQLTALAASAQESHTLSESQLQLLHARLAQLRDASTRLGRKDWLAVFVGVMLTLAVTAALPPEVVRDAMESFVQDVKHLFAASPITLPSG